MKILKSNKKLLALFLFILAGYFSLFFTFSSAQTVLKCFKTREIEKVNVAKIFALVEQISPEIPFENRESWLDSFQQNPQLILACAETSSISTQEEKRFAFSISDATPLSIMF